MWDARVVILLRPFRGDFCRVGDGGEWVVQLATGLVKATRLGFGYMLGGLAMVLW